MRHEKPEYADGEPAGDRLQPQGRIRHPQKTLAQIEQQLDEPNGSKPADDPEDDIDAQLGWVDQLVSRDVKERTVAE